MKTNHPFNSMIAVLAIMVISELFSYSAVLAQTIENYSFGQQEPATRVFPPQFLPKPCNLQGEDVGHAVELIWEAPEICHAGGNAGTTAGFNIYRSNTLLASVDGNTFSFVDSSYPGFAYLPAGTYSYSITALYNFSNGTIESFHEGPISTVVEGEASFVSGIVYDCSSSLPLSGVTLRWGHITTTTSPGGSFTIAGVNGVVHDLTLSKPFYFTKRYPNVAFQDIPTLGLCLVPFGIYVTPTTINEVLPPTGISSHNVTITNTSSDTIDWNVFIAFGDTGRSHNNETHRLELAPPTSWLTVNPTIGTLAPGAGTVIGFHLNANQLVVNDYEDAVVAISTSPNVGVVPVQVSLLVQGTGPIIDVEPDGAYLWKPPITFQDDITISNTGDAPLNFSYRVEYQDIDSHLIQHDNATIHSSIGTGYADSWICAARFTPAELSQMYGYMLRNILIHISNDKFTNVTVKVWEDGSFGNPGNLIYSEDVTNQVIINNWTTIVLNQAIELVAGKEYWIGYSIDATSGFPSTVDSGPMVNGKGGWIYFDNSWQQLTDYSLDYNWCIRGRIWEHYEWLSFSPSTGTILPGEQLTGIYSVDITVVPGYQSMFYFIADLVFISNDLFQPELDFNMTIIHHINYQKETHTANHSIFPNPAHNQITVKTTAETRVIRIFNSGGAVVLEKLLSGDDVLLTISISALPPGLYVLQQVTDKGVKSNERFTIVR